MDDTLFLIIFMLSTFIAIPSTVLISRKLRFWLVTEGYMKKKGTRLGARARLEAYLFVETNYGLYLDVFQVFLSMFSCGCFVAEMYRPDLREQGSWQALELTIGTMFGLDYIFRFYLAKRKLKYFFSPLALVDFVTVLPTFVFAALVVKGNSVTFLRVLRLMRALRVLRVLKILRLVMGKHTTAAQTDVTRMAIKVGFTCLCLIFCAACFFALVEGMDFHIAFYYVCIEALSRPHCPIMTVPGYFLMYGLVFLTVTLLPPQLAGVVAAYAQRRDVTRMRLRSNDEHLVLCGDLSHDTLDHVLHALFADTSLGFKVCVMTTNPPNVYMKRTVEDLNSRVPGAVTHITGTVMEHSDLEKAHARVALRIIVFCTLQCEDRQAMDRITLTRVMSIKCHCPAVPLCCMVLLPETQNQISALPKWNAKFDRVVCAESLKIRVLVLTAVSPGVAALVSNLISVADQTAEILEAGGSFAEEYSAGAGMSIYDYPIAPPLEGHSFTKVVWATYTKYGVLLIGVGRTVDGSRRVVINPGMSEYLRAGDVGYWVCPSQQTLYSMDRDIRKQGKLLFDVTVGAIFSMIEANPQPDRTSAFELIPAHTVAERAIAMDMTPQTPTQTPLATPRHQKRASSNVDPSEHERVQRLREFCCREYGCNMLQMVADACDTDEWEWVPASPVKTPKITNRRVQRILDDPISLDWPVESSRAPRHVIICGESYSILYLVNVLTDSGCRVTVINQRADELEAQAECDSTLVNGIVGQPSETTLLQAGMGSCSAAIIMAHEKPAVSMDQPDIDAFIQDTQALMVMNFFMQHAPHVFVIIELINSASSAFVRLPLDPEFPLMSCESVSSLAFAGGGVFSSVLNIQILSRIHTLPDVVQLADTLLLTRSASESKQHRNTIRMLQIPRHLVGRRFGEVVFHMITGGDCIPIALYRQLDNQPFPFVFTNPDPNTEVAERDQMFVLSVSAGIQPQNALQRKLSMRGPNMNPRNIRRNTELGTGHGARRLALPHARSVTMPLSPLAESPAFARHR